MNPVAPMLVLAATPFAPTEHIVAPPSTEVIEAVATYDVKDGKIIHVTFLRK